MSDPNKSDLPETSDVDATVQAPSATPAEAEPPTFELKRKDLIDRVVATSGVKKSDAKVVVEAMLGVMGQALSDGASLNLQPFGKARIARRKDLPNGEVLVLRLRRSTKSRTETATLAVSRDGR